MGGGGGGGGGEGGGCTAKRCRACPFSIIAAWMVLQVLLNHQLCWEKGISPVLCIAATAAGDDCCFRAMDFFPAFLVLRLYIHGMEGGVSACLGRVEFCTNIVWMEPCRLHKVMITTLTGNVLNEYEWASDARLYTLRS